MLPPKEQMEQMKREQQNRFKPTAYDEAEPTMSVGFGPPELEVYDNDQLEEDYKNFEQSLEPPMLEEEPTEEFGFTPPPTWQGVGEHPTPPSMKQQGNTFLHDQPIFPNGPTRQEVLSWKKQFETDGHGVFLTEHAGESFIWRTLNRSEYREIMALPNLDPLQREEIICEVCVLFPYNYNFTSMASRKAGIPAVLAEQIMQESGFVQPTPPIRL